MKRIIYVLASWLIICGSHVTFAQGESIPYVLSAKGAVTRSVADKLGDEKSVFDFMTATQVADVKSGARHLDDSQAIQAALNSGGAIQLGSYNYRLGRGIVIPSGSFLTSHGGMGATVPTAGGGATLTCDLSVQTCVTLGGAGVSNVSAGIEGVVITRSAGSPPPGSIGLLVQKVYNPTISYVLSLNHAIGFEFSSGDTEGISAQPDHLFTGGITDAHIVISTWPELRVDQSRFGMNGSTDKPCNTYVRITGGSISNAASGPNTIYFSNSQFNQGKNSATHWLEFVGEAKQAISDIGEYSFSNVHVESVGRAYLYSDPSWKSVTRLKLSNVHLNSPVEFYNLNSLTAINDWQINNSFFAGSYVISTSKQINFMQMANNSIAGDARIMAPAASGQNESVVSLSNNIWKGRLSFDGRFGHLTDIGDSVISGNFSDTTEGDPGVAFKLLRLNGFSDTISTYNGVADATGNINFLHGLGQLAPKRVMSVTALYEAKDGSVRPATINYIDGKNLSVSAGKQGADCPVVVHLTMSASQNPGF